MQIIFWGSGIGLVLILLVLLAWTGWLSLRISLGADTRKPTDAGPWHILVLPSVLPTVELLTQWHFRRLGETQTLLPSQATPTSTWILLDETSTTVAEVVEFGSDAMVAFWSVCQDTALVETMYPIGESIDLPDFRLQFIATNLEDTYHEHGRQVTTFVTQHGAVQSLQTMAEYLSWDTIFRIRHAKRVFRRGACEALIKLIALGYALVIVIAMLLTQGWHLLLSEGLLVQLLSFLLPALLLSSFSNSVTRFKWTRFTKSKSTA